MNPEKAAETVEKDSEFQPHVKKAITISILAMVLAFATLGSTRTTKSVSVGNIQISNTNTIYEFRILRQLVMSTSIDFLNSEVERLESGQDKKAASEHLKSIHRAIDHYQQEIQSLESGSNRDDTKQDLQLKLNDLKAQVQTSKAGDILMVIDDTDAKLALAKAEADYAKAEAEADRTKTDYTRRAALIKSGSVSQEEVTTTNNAYKSAQATMNAAKAAWDQAKVDLDRTTIRSPIDGTVAKRQVELGQRVQIGSPMMSVVPHDVHVDANFKEVQLRKVKIGQAAELTSDVYGSSVVYHGKVVGLSGGTGSAFSLIPAQNATGNWIKVVQRLPVRIELDPAELDAHPLEVGLSVDVDINISNPPETTTGN